MYRTLPPRDPRRQELPGVLVNLANALSGEHDHAGAVRALEGAVSLYRKMQEEQPGIHLPGLATALVNLGDDLGASGDSHAAGQNLAARPGVCSEWRSPNREVTGLASDAVYASLLQA